MRMNDIADIAHAAAGYDYMGFDLSLTGTGVVVRNATSVVTMTIAPPKDCDRGSARLDWFDKAFTALLQYRFKQVAVEGYSFASKFSRPHRLGEQGGLFRLAAYRACHRLLELPPKTLCMFMDGRGNIPKKQRKALVLANYGIEVETDDEADALALCQAAMMSHKRIFSEPYQLDAIEKGVYLECAKVVPDLSQVRHRRR